MRPIPTGILFGLMCISLAGCATITQGTTQLVHVTSTPQGAACSLTRQGTPLAGVRQTPETVTVPRSVYNIDVECQLPDGQKGYALLKTTLTPMVAGNVLVGGLIGAGVDAASGAMNQYPESITVSIPSSKPLQPAEPKKKPGGDSYRSNEKPVS